MKSTRIIHLIVFVLLLSSLACNLPLPTSQPPAATPAAATAPVGSPTAAPLPDTPLPPTETIPPPTEAPPPTEMSVPPTEPPAATEPPSPEPAWPLPAGFITVPASGGRVFLYNTSGQITAERSTPDEFPSYTNLHAAGSASSIASGNASDPLQLPLVYFTYQNGGELMMNINNNISRLMSAPSFYTLAGAPGEPVLAYSSIDWGDTLRSTLYVGSLDSLPNAQPVAVVDEPEFWAAKPLAVVVQSGQPVGIWYTTVAYGIGGDIVFEPHRTLSYLNLDTGSSQHIYDNTIDPCGLSPDQSWVAHVASWSHGDPSPITLVHNMDESNAVAIPLLPSSDRGAGEAVFSPDNQYVAWKEGSGWLMADVPNFHATIRIATVTGSITAEIGEAVISNVTGAQKVDWVRPVGWLDGETLLLEVRLNEWDNASLMRVRYDGSGLVTLAAGSFAGFLYP